MNYEIVEIEEDEAGKFRYRILVNNEYVMFKFQTIPTENELQETIADYDTRMQAAKMEQVAAMQAEEVVDATTISG